ncbi:MAG: 2Fe-2S iron-sulfur cluster binding domain-containing protein [Erysipelotrichaceae bacterium]|nr:2Fe-2S iron-sulfur cluster binding domain-containing protein [Erysipelotrichaceae bacterium]
MSAIKHLNKMKFTRTTPKREAVIGKASNAITPDSSFYKSNRIAAALHPAYQDLVISQMVMEDELTCSYYLVPDKEAGCEKLAYFQAGQYLNVELNIEGHHFNRPYSISSSPRQAKEEGYYRLSIALMKGFIAPDYIRENWKVGTRVRVSAPLGNFTYNRLRDGKNILALVGGNGVTPFVSIAHAIADGDIDADMLMLYGNKDLKSALFRQELQQLADSCPRIKIVDVLEDEEAEGCEHGLITTKLIKKYRKDRETSLFVCGPQAMYDYLNKELPKLKIPKKYLRLEIYGQFNEPSRLKEYPKSQKDREYRLTVRQGEITYELKCKAGTSLVNAIEQSGIRIPVHCRSGYCGFCHSRLISGEIFTPAFLEHRRKADHDYGYIHPCCSFPLSDLEIEIPLYRN